MSPRYALFVLLTLLLTALVGYGAFRTAQLLRVWQPDHNLLLLPGENALRLGLLVVCVALGLLSGLSPAQLGWQLAPLAPQVLLGVAAGTGLALLFHGATRWLIAATGYRYYSASVLEYVVPRMPREFAAVAGVMVLIVLLEELLFRSLLVGGLLPLVPWPLLLAATGIAFGVMHSPQGLWGMAGAGLAGAGLGALFLWSGSLVLPTVTHYIANLLQIWLVMRRPPPQVSD